MRSNRQNATETRLPTGTQQILNIWNLIDSLSWNCEFLRVRATLSCQVLDELQCAGNVSAAQPYLNAALADVLLDVRIGLERQLAALQARHQVRTSLD